MFKIIAIPFGWIMRMCYTLVKNYGLALLLFTFIIKLIMLPTSLKQQKSSAKINRLQPKLEQIKKKYANNRDKLNEATMELYNQEGVNPGGSCLPMLLTYIILFAIIEVVYAPMSYISGIQSQKIDIAVQTVVDCYNISQAVKNDVAEGEETALTMSQRLAENTNIAELFTSYNEGFKNKLTDERLESVISAFEQTPNLDEYFNDTTKVSSRLIAAGASSRVQLIVLSVAKDQPQLFDSEIVDFCDNFNYTFLGLYLGAYPSWKSIYVLIPILSLISQVLLTVLSQIFMKRNGQDMSQGKGMMTMLYFMPLLSFWIAFSFPAGIGIYWIFSSVLQLLQTIFINLYYTRERMDKILAKEAKKTARRPSLYQMALEQQKAQRGEVTTDRKSLLDDLDQPEVKLSKSERKEVERQKINEARKKLFDDDEADVDPRVLEARRRMAEKYKDE